MVPVSGYVTLISNAIVVREKTHVDENFHDSAVYFMLAPVTIEIEQ